jgi:hypothetical protein
MTVKLIAILECDGCGVIRGHGSVDNLLTASRQLRRDARLSGWTEFGSDHQLDECYECGSRSFNAHELELARQAALQT